MPWTFKADRSTAGIVRDDRIPHYSEGKIAIFVLNLPVNKKIFEDNHDLITSNTPDVLEPIILKSHTEEVINN